MPTMMRRGGRKTWEAVWQVDGKKKYRTLRTRDKVVAARRFAELLQDLEAAKDGLPPKKRDIEWDDYVEKYLDRLAAGSAPATVARCRAAMAAFRRLVGPRMLSDATGEALERFILARKADGKKPGTINRDVCSIRAAIRRAPERGFLEVAVGRVAKVPDARRRPYFFTRGLVEKLLRVADAFWRVVIHLGVYTGLRRNEMLHLYWSDVDFEKKTLSVTPKQGWTPKTYECRTIPMHPVLVEVLRKWKEVNPGRREVLHWPSRPEDFSSQFTALRKRAGLELGTLHTLRHTFGSWLASMDVNLLKIKELMGHKDIASTMVCLHLQANDLAEAVGKLWSLAAVESMPADSLNGGVSHG